MPQSVIARYRRPTDPRRTPPAPAGRSIWFWLTVIAASTVIGVLITDLFDPGSRAGATPGGVPYFAATFGFFLVLFATAAALLSTIFDLMGAWERSTPESERRSGDGGADGGFFDLLGFGDGGGDCGDGGGD